MEQITPEDKVIDGIEAHGTRVGGEAEEDGNSNIEEISGTLM